MTPPPRKRRHRLADVRWLLGHIVYVAGAAVIAGLDWLDARRRRTRGRVRTRR